MFQGANVLKNEKWKILIVDDEKEVHDVTKLIFRRTVIFEKKIEFHSAYSKTEAIKILNKETDFCLVLLDVVMDTPKSGLEITKYIRDKLKNKNIRIILRTGYPGKLGANKDIIEKYEIDDFKEKTELTHDKLLNVLITSIRTYKRLIKMKNNIKILRALLECNNYISFQETPEEFVDDLLHKLITPFIERTYFAILKKKYNSFEVKHHISNYATPFVLAINDFEYDYNQLYKKINDTSLIAFLYNDRFHDTYLYCYTENFELYYSLSLLDTFIYSFKSILQRQIHDYKGNH